MIRVRDLNVHYKSQHGEVHAVKGVNLEVAKGEFYTLLGPSGCGKTTTLRCLAGLETPSDGEIVIASQAVYSGAGKKIVPSYRRDIGMVFQSYAIWPHMTVFDNVAFPLRESREKLPKAEIAARVTEALRMVQLSDYAERPAPMLSGGQQQRLALARAIVRQPAVLLLDEPLSNLDARLRDETRLEIRSLVKRLNMTTIYVTHDQIEALSMSDRVAVMEAGKIAQEAAPRDIYQNPNSLFVASFIGKINIIPGTVAGGPPGTGPLVVETSWGRLNCRVNATQQPGGPVKVAVRPEDMRIEAVPSDSATSSNRISGEVVEFTFLGESVECRVANGNESLYLRLHPKNRLSVGQKIVIAIDVDDTFVLPNAG